MIFICVYEDIAAILTYKPIGSFYGIAGRNSML